MGSNAAASRAIEKSVLQAEMIELRMDLIPNGNLNELIAKSRFCSPSLKIICTYRDAGRGGKQLPDAGSRAALLPGAGRDGKTPEMEKRRIELLKEAVALGCDYVDCELDTPEPLRNELLSTIRAHNDRTKLIVSHHDFRATPSLRVLKKLLRDCINAQADVAKIVTYARQIEDNLRILNLIGYARQEGRAIVAFCMGERGRSSRIMGPFIGSLITFASLRRGFESAPGQLTVREVKEIFRYLGKIP
jgi:3-dehydroquinate dehydratase type I